MATRYFKVNRKKTVTFPPYGRLPIYDAKEDVVLPPLAQKHVRDGKKYNPAACAIADNIREEITTRIVGRNSLFPGVALGALVFKTHTLVAVSDKKKIRVLRYVHVDAVRRKINGWDKGSKTCSLSAGDVVTLLAPKGGAKLGVSNGRSNPGVAPNKDTGRERTGCEIKGRKRGVYADPLHAKAAQQDADSRTQVIVS